MIEIPGYDMRFSELEDLTYLEKWFEDPASLEEFVFNAQEKEEALKNWIGFSKFKASLTATIDEVPCGIGTLFLMPYRKVAHHASFQLIVDPIFRRKGIGESLVKNLQNLAKTRFRLEKLHIELYGTSSFLSLVKKMRFQEIFRQENYVKTQGVKKPRVMWECAL